MKYILIFILSLSIISCSNEGVGVSIKEEKIYNINLSNFYNQESRGLLILYPISVLEDSLLRKIMFPDLSGLLDTAFAQIYFTGKNSAAIENGILMLIGNYSSESPIFWTDYNNDLNFSNDNTSIAFSDEFIDLSIPNSDQLDLYHAIRFHKPDSAKKEQTYKMIEKYITKGKPFVDFYFDQRRNIRVGDFIYEQDSLRIGIMDYNVNGKYNDLGSDRIVTGKYDSKINGTEEAYGAVVLDSLTYFHSTNYAFKVVEIAENGTSLSIKPTLEDNSEKRIEVGDFISDYSFELLSGEKVSTHDFLDGKKYLYLNFWASWCTGCHQEIEDLNKINTKLSSELTIVSLNYNEGVTKTKSMIDKYEISWINGLSSSEINNALFIYGLPRNILISPSGKIIEMNIHPSVLLKQFNEH